MRSPPWHRSGFHVIVTAYGGSNTDFCTGPPRPPCAQKGRYWANPIRSMPRS